MAKSYFYDESISDWRELVKGEQGEQGERGPRGPQGPAIDIETGLPISVNTSVGTRVYIGDTMIYGDTGWRILYADGLPDKFSGQISIRRIGDLVYMRFFNMSLPAGEGAHIILNSADDDIPYGFRAASSRRQQGIISGRSNPYATHFISAYGSIAWVKEITNTGLNLNRPQGDIVGMISYWTDQSWPTSLPGTPL